MSKFPSHWDFKCIGDFASRVRRKNVGGECQDPMTISAVDGLVSQKDYFKKIVASKNTENYTLLHKNDFAYNKSYSEGYPVGAARRLKTKDKGIVSPLYICFELDKEQIEMKFADYLFDSDWFVQAIFGIAKEGARSHGLLNIGIDDFFAALLPIPPLPEQKKIAEILSGIDDCIHALTSQIRKLDIARSALSRELISGVLGPQKKSSYGPIPCHWKESNLGEILGAANLQTGPFGSQLHAHEYTSEGIPVIMPQDMKNCSVVTSKIARIAPARAETLSKHVVIPGDILFSRRGDIGRHVVITGNESGWICGTGCLRARTEMKINSVFLSELLRHRFALEWLNTNAVGQTMLNLNTGILSELPVVVPPMEEQEKIADSLGSVNDRSKKISDQIALAQNLKIAIASDLLSGRKRVSV